MGAWDARRAPTRTGSICAMTASHGDATARRHARRAAGPGLGTGTTISVLLYSDDVTTRDAGPARRGPSSGPRRARSSSWLECATAAAVIAAVENGAFDVLILDGEAAPIGGLGLCRQLKNEIFDCPPILVLTGRPQDGWLATWSLADLAVPHPLDPIALALGRGRAGSRRTPQRLLIAVTARGPGRRTPGRTCSPLLIAGSDLAPTRPPGRWTRSWAARRSPVQVAGFLVALRAKGETRRGDARPGRRRCSPTPTGSRCPGRASTSSAPAATAPTRSTSRRWPRSSSRPAGSGWSSTATGRRRRPPARPTCSRRSGSTSTLRPTRVAEVAAEAGITFCFAQAFHPALPARRRGARRARRGDGVQLPRPAHQPGPAARMPRSGSPTRGWRRSWPGCSPARGRTPLVFRGDDGLDELTLGDDVVGVVGARRRGDASASSTRSDVGPRAAARSRRCAAATPAYNAERGPRDLFAGERGAGARRGAAQRGRWRWRWPGTRLGFVGGRRSRRTCAPGWRGPRRPSTRGAATRLVESWVAATTVRLDAAGQSSPSRPSANAASRSCRE